MDRRTFILSSMAAAGALATGCATRAGRPAERPLFEISLAEWSLHRAIRSGSLDHLDFPLTATRDYGIGAVEYVSTLFAAKDAAYVAELKRRAADSGVRSLLIMIDAEGALGDPEAAGRAQAVENHARWVDAAAVLGCHSIRVNAESRGTPEEQQKLVADGLARLCERADRVGIDVIIENHGGHSSDAAWLAATIRLAGHPRAGTLPDFGNFPPDADRYAEVATLMPFARAVSAKSHDFDASGNETRTDYERMLGIVLDAGYRGFVGVEYEGERLSEPEGIRATKALLERVRERLAQRARV
jgi:sugar phosphate isomerase/epimerase